MVTRSKRFANQGSAVRKLREIQSDMFVDESLDEFWVRMKELLTEEQIREIKKVRNAQAFRSYCEANGIEAVFISGN